MSRATFLASLVLVGATIAVPGVSMSNEGSADRILAVAGFGVIIPGGDSLSAVGVINDPVGAARPQVFGEFTYLPRGSLRPITITPKCAATEQGPRATKLFANGTGSDGKTYYIEIESALTLTARAKVSTRGVSGTICSAGGTALASVTGHFLIIPVSSKFNCLGAPATINGTPGDDVINGTPGPDVIAGGPGNDTIDGKGGSDVICGDTGADTITADGNDLIFGGDATDRITARSAKPGDSGGNLLNGDNGDDTIFVDSPSNIVSGGPGKDYIKEGSGGSTSVLFGGSGNDFIQWNSSDLVNGIWAFGDDGNDVLGEITNSPGKGADHLYGGNGKDHLYGGNGNDDLHGDAGDDQVLGQNGTDLTDGGSGYDQCDDFPQESDVGVNCEL